KDGIAYFFLQFFAVLMNGLDAIFIAQILTPAHVAVYVVGFRLFQIMMYPTQVFITPLLPAFNDAFSKGDTFWIKRTLGRYSKSITLFSILFAAAFYLGANFIIKIWI